MAENIFNKSTYNGNGTLIGNWQEERDLRSFTGQGRTIPKEHIPKKHGDLENPITHNKVFDNTKSRINGKTEDQLMDTWNYQYGKGQNPADSIPTKGLRTKDLERQIYEEVLQEQREKEEHEERMRQMRYFDTTTGTTHTPQDMTENIIGKRVMYTQDKKFVCEDKDEQLAVEHGFGHRSQKTTDD